MADCFEDDGRRWRIHVSTLRWTLLYSGRNTTSCLPAGYRRDKILAALLCMTQIGMGDVENLNKKKARSHIAVVKCSTRHLLPGTTTSNTSVPSTHNLVSSHLQIAARSNHCNSASHTHTKETRHTQQTRLGSDITSFGCSFSHSLTLSYHSASSPLPSAIGGMPHKPP